MSLVQVNGEGAPASSEGEVFLNSEHMLQELSNFIFTNKYARYIEDLQRRETWDECVDRVMNMHLNHYGFLPKKDKDKIRWAFDVVRDKRVVPSMRSMQFGGKAVEAHHARLYNCFRRDTEFITKEGVRSFENYEHGDQVEVLSHTGQWRQAMVKSYGKQKLNKIVLSNDEGVSFEEVFATANHRWILENGVETTELKIDDALLTLDLLGEGEKGESYVVVEIQESTKEEVWCLEVEEDKSFVLMSGLTTGNCSVTHIHSLRTFAEVFYLLLAGCGVTIGLNKKFMSRLPDLVGADDKTGTVLNYVVEDTIEGWADSVEALLMCYFKNTAFSGRKIVFDYSKIRKKGTPLITGGGKAPGHKGLKASHQKIKALLDYIIEEQNQARMKTINAYDIVMHCADAVLSGGIRRAATAAIFEIDDEDMINAKTNFKVDKKQKFELNEETGKYEGYVFVNNRKYEVAISEWEYKQLGKEKTISWNHIEPQRARSNNSVLLRRDKVTREQFAKIVERTRQWGEPGFVFTDHDDQLLNPCYEVSFIPVTDDGQAGTQFCVAGDTKLITKDGIVRRIDETIGSEVEIWNGDSWKKVKPFQTGTQKDLYRVFFNDGSYLDVTDNHRFLVKTHREKEFSEKTTKEIIEFVADYKDNCSNQLQLPRSNIKMPENLGENESNAYDYGYFLGDGTIGSEKVKRSGCGFAAIYEGTFEPKFVSAEISERVYKNYRGTKYKYVKFPKLEKELCKLLKHHSGLPDFLFGWNENSVMQFMGGWIDADGSKANKGVRLYGSEHKLRDAQLLLSKFGINSSVNLFQVEGYKTNLCERKNDLYYLQIPNAKKILSQKFDLSNGKDPRWRGAYQLIKKVEKLPGKHATYCLEEPELHQCVFNNVLTKQCNLSSINGAKITTLEEYLESVEAATVIGTLQAGYTEFPYLSKTAKKLTEEEALLGVSMTGVMDNPEVLLNARNQFVASQYCVKVNKLWAEKIGINQAARTTLLKPEGTSSLVLKSASGIHPHHARRYFRRVQINKIDPVYKFFRKYNPHMCEESVWSANKTDDVITWPIEVPEKAMVKEDLTAIDHLNIIKNTQENWVIPGSTEANKKPIHHNVSCTVVIGEEAEWEKVIDYLYENRAFFTAVSMLPAIGDKAYQQAPLERVLEEDLEKWNEIVKNYNSVDYTELQEKEDKTSVQDTVACGGGACEIV